MIITLNDVNKTYPGAVPLHVLKGINLEIDRGELVAIMGASGSGKSTLLNILGILDNYDTGTYTLDGTLIRDLSENRAAELRNKLIGFVFQSFNLIDTMSIYDNIMLPLNNLPLSRAEKRARVDEAMKRMGISHRSGHRPQQLSGGQQQRAAIARAIVAKPGLILADEPTGNLDSTNGAEVMSLLDELHRDGATIVMVTHSQKDAAHADRIINLFDGQLVENLNDKL